jgi:hypothetical protein
MSHNLVTEIEKLLTGNTVGTQIAFIPDTLLKILVSLSIAQVMQKQQPYLHSNPT